MNTHLDVTLMVESVRGRSPLTGPPTLYNHALESIFAWLQPAQLATVMATCKRCYHIVGVTMRRTEGTAEVCFSKCTLHFRPMYVRSPLVRHVAHVTNNKYCNGVTAVRLFDEFPYLQSFVGKLNIITADDVAGIRFRPTLTLVDIALPRVYRSDHATRWNYILLALSRLPCLRSIKVHLMDDDSFSLGALRGMRQLEELVIAGRCVFSHQFLDELRALTWLKHVHVENLSHILAAPEYLFRSPCDMKWERVTTWPQSSRILLESMQSLPELTYVRVDHVVNQNNSYFDAIRSSFLAESLCVMSKLSSLRLSSSFIRSADMHHIMTTCKLQEIDLETINTWDSFDCFLTGPITHTLRSLRISQCDHILPIEIRKLGALAALRALTVAYMWSRSDVRVLRIPSQILPTLEKFTYL